jgi:hypothetical protein
LYNVAFGDLNFTDLGKTHVYLKVAKEIQKLHTKEKHHTSLLVHLFSPLLSDKFKDFKVDNTIFEKLFYPKNTVLGNKREIYLKAEKQFCEECKTL